MSRVRERLSLPVGMALLILLLVVWAGTEMMSRYAGQQQKERNQLLAGLVATQLDNDVDGFYRGVRISAASIDWPEQAAQVPPLLRQMLEAYRASTQVAWLSRRGGFESIAREGVHGAFGAQQLLVAMHSAHFGSIEEDFIIRHALDQGDLFVVVSGQLVKDYWLPEFVGRDFEVQLLPLQAQTIGAFAGEAAMTVIPRKVVTRARTPVRYSPDALILSPVILFALLMLSFSMLVLLAYRQRWLHRTMKTRAQRLRTLVNGLDEGILGLSKDGAIVFANNAARRLLNIQSELSDERLEHFIDASEDQLNLRRLAEVSVPAPENSGELSMHVMGAGPLPVRYRIEPLDDAEDDLNFVFIFSDISYFRSSETLMREQNERLQRMNKQLEEYSFLASHDLREPLRVIISYAKILERSLGDSLGAKEQEALYYLTDSAHKMNRRIEDLERMAAISRSDLQIQSLSLQTLVEGVRHELGPALEPARGQLVVRTLSDSLIADRKLFEYALKAVLQNAIESAVPERPLQIEIYSESDEQWLRIIVSDNGCGIPADSLQSIFRPFYRLSKNSDGSGMGLTICVKAMERHGGRVSVESKENQGSRFTLHFPQREQSMYS